jgi:hypothetical protein
MIVWNVTYVKAIITSYGALITLLYCGEWSGLASSAWPCHQNRNIMAEIVLFSVPLKLYCNTRILLGVSCVLSVVYMPQPFFFNSHSWGWSPNWVHSARRPLIGLMYMPRVIVRMENLLKLRLAGGNGSTRRKPAPAPLCPPQILLDQTRARTRAAAVLSYGAAYATVFLRFALESTVVNIVRARPGKRVYSPLH